MYSLCPVRWGRRTIADHATRWMSPTYGALRKRQERWLVTKTRGIGV